MAGRVDEVDGLRAAGMKGVVEFTPLRPVVGVGARVMESIPLDDHAREGFRARVNSRVAIHAPPLGARAQCTGIGVEPAPAGNIALLDHDIVRILEPDAIAPGVLDRESAHDDVGAVNLDAVGMLVRDVDCRGPAGGGGVEKVAVGRAGCGDDQGVIGMRGQLDGSRDREILAPRAGRERGAGGRVTEGELDLVARAGREVDEAAAVFMGGTCGVGAGADAGARIEPERIARAPDAAASGAEAHVTDRPGGAAAVTPVEPQRMKGRDCFHGSEP